MSPFRVFVIGRSITGLSVLWRTPGDMIGRFVLVLSTGMLTITLCRYHQTPNLTCGVLLLNDQVICATMEPPFLDNRPGKSSIPVGTYLATRVKSPKFGSTFDVAVPGRSLIRFHRGNSPSESRGCILCVTFVYGQYGYDSRTAFRRFLDALDGVQQFSLDVRSCG